MYTFRGGLRARHDCGDVATEIGIEKGIGMKGCRLKISRSPVEINNDRRADVSKILDLHGSRTIQCFTI